MIVAVGKSSNRVTTPISTAAIVAPTSGIREKSPAITASGARKGTPRIVEHDVGGQPGDERDEHRPGHVAADRAGDPVERALEAHALLGWSELERGVDPAAGRCPA